MAKPNVKEQIVATSLNLLHSKGFNATSVQDITDAAGVPKGSFYNHFPSKEALGLEVLQRYGEQATQVRGLLHDAALPPLARIRQYFEKLVEYNAVTDFNCGCMLGNFSAELSTQIPAMREAMRLGFEEWAATLAQVIEEGQRSGGIVNTVPAETLSEFLIDAWQGAVLRSKAAHSRAPLDRFVRMTVEHVLS